MTKHNLIRRSTVIGDERLKKDYTVWCDERSIGRIKFAEGKTGQNPGWAWMINVPLPIPSWASGATETLEGATAAFREAWEQFYATLSPETIAHWHATDDACKWS